MGLKQFIRSCSGLILIAILLVQIHPPLAARPVQVKVQGNARGTASAAGPKLRVMENYGNLPLSFEANQGQTDSQVKFLSRGNGYSLFLTSTEAVLSIQSRDRKGAGAHPLAYARGSDRQSAQSADVLRMKLVGANPTAQVTGLDELPGKSNYFIGNDPAKWRTNLPTYAKVRYENVYPGIDLVYYGEPAPAGRGQRQLEYDFVVAPGADPRAIRLAFPSRDREGAVALRIDAQGDLVLEAEGSKLRLHQPVIYQEISGARQRIGGNFVIKNANEVSFDIARYDANKPLIIDPVILYSTYLGGGGNDQVAGIAADSSGNVYVAGSTTSTDFPTVVPFQGTYQGGNTSPGDAFVSKINATGSSLIYSTYLGGSFSDAGIGIAVDSLGSAYITGNTGSPDFPTTPGAFQSSFRVGNNQAFFSKLNPGGNALTYSSYLTSLEPSGIAADQSGNAYITGNGNFPTTPGAFNTSCGGITVAKFDASGTALAYSTGVCGGGFANGIAVDSAGSAYVTGYTSSRSFPTTSGAFQTAPGLDVQIGVGSDAVVFKLNPNGSALAYSTYLGGKDVEKGLAIAVDSSGNAYVAGSTSSSNFPLSNPFQSVLADTSGAFVTKLNSTGTTLLYSTFLGAGNGASSIALDSFNNAYVTGVTPSANFPTVNFLQKTSGELGVGGIFITKFNPVGSVIYSGALGAAGTSISRASVAVDAAGNVYLAGDTISFFPTTVNAFKTQTTADALPEIFIVKMADGNAIPSISSLAPPAATGGGQSLTLAVNGINFVSPTQGDLKLPGSTVRWNGSDRPTQFINTTQLTASIPASDIASAGTAQVTVFNPAPGGGSSNALPFIISPLINPGGVVNAASFAAGAPVAPGSIISIFGSSLAPSAVAAGATPLPTGLLTTSVTINARPIPLYYVNPTQINAQVPFETPPGTATLAVTVNGTSSPAVTFPVAATAPGIFLYGANRAVAQNPDGSINASDHPAKPGDVILVYMTGQGAVSNPIPTGAPALGSPLSLTLATTTATIGGSNAEVLFSGLAPGFVGLLQANIRIPNVAAGDQTLVVTIGGAASNSALITVGSQ